ncbi:MAG: Cys-Xaa-Xaa-Xaa repeat radical SAM target protein [Paludibacteraceae bacterium]
MAENENYVSSLNLVDGKDYQWLNSNDIDDFKSPKDYKYVLRIEFDDGECIWNVALLNSTLYADESKIKEIVKFLICSRQFADFNSYKYQLIGLHDSGQNLTSTDVVDRRDFFRNLKYAMLPIVATMTLTSFPVNLLAHEASVVSTSCNGGCEGGCSDGCYGGCQGSCSGSCRQACHDTCKQTCTNRCSNNCDTTCHTGCRQSCKGGCMGGCYKSCDITCQMHCKGTCVGGCAHDCMYYMR